MADTTERDKIEVSDFQAIVRKLLHDTRGAMAALATLVDDTVQGYAVPVEEWRAAQKAMRSFLSKCDALQEMNKPVESNSEPLVLTDYLRTRLASTILSSSWAHCWKGEQATGIVKHPEVLDRAFSLLFSAIDPICSKGNGVLTWSKELSASGDEALLMTAQGEEEIGGARELKPLAQEWQQFGCWPAINLWLAARLFKQELGDAYCDFRDGVVFLLVELSPKER